MLLEDVLCRLSSTNVCFCSWTPKLQSGVGNRLCGYGPIWSVSCSLLHVNVWIVWCEGHKADLDFACCHLVSNVCLLLTIIVELINARDT